MNTPHYPSFGCLGRARAGKGTMAAIITSWAKYNSLPSQIISFADPIKDFLTLLIGRSEPFRGNDAQRNAPLADFPWRSFEAPVLAGARRIGVPEDVIENGSPTGRQLMQIFGTDIMRNQFYDQTWFRIAANRAKNFAGITIVDDVRFPNEARPVTEGGMFDYVIKVTRESVPKLDHASENSVDQVPQNHLSIIMPNDNSIEDLSARLDLWLSMMAMVRRSAAG